MANAAIDATIQVVLEIVLSLANDRIDMVLGFKKELERLTKTAKRIRGLLADADDKMHSLVVQDWLKDLEEEAFKAENVLDELSYEYLRREVKYRSQVKGKVCLFFSFFSTTGFRLKMASKLRDINMNLERINREANDIGLVFRFQIEAALPVPAPTGATTSRQTDSVGVPNVVGRANDESKIVEMLLSPSDKVVSVIPIVGMAGLGKTTLAKSVYNHPKISEHFDKKIWVCVAEKIDSLQLFKFILESLTREKVDVDRRDTIVQKIREELWGKRYFLVLDDVWNDEEGLWNNFFITLIGLNTTNGSWCLATTRLEQVANTMSRHLKMNVDPHKLGKLSDDECWSILKGKVVGEEEVPNELEAIKMEILRKCGGLPLSATLIGGLLLNKGKEEWQFIVEKGLLHVDQDNVKQIIKVSVDHLSPASVKKCFVYCSIFHQDTKIEKDLLIELWMAEGFLQLDSKNESLMEAIGDNYIRILLQSSLLEEVNEWGKICYKMHDLVHEFAKSALNEDRYLARNLSQGIVVDIIKKNLTSLRTLILENSIPCDILSEFECLHVLKLFGEDVKELPASIEKLIHLRFLDISNSRITKLPKSLCKLYNLQTLRIGDCKLKEGLPKQMSNLIGLRHLHYYSTCEEFLMPSKMGRLIHLQKLEFFSVGQEDGRGIEELGNLKDLRGSLEIRNLELVNGKEGAKKAKLFEKPNLYKLKYIWGSGDRKSDSCDENVLEVLQPHRNLQELEIHNFMGDQFPGWFITLSTLVELKFIYCRRCRELPALGQLPFLERLELIALENIRSIGLSFYGISSGGGQVKKFFPALKYLSLKYLGNLDEWKDENEVRSTTSTTEVDLFPVLKTLHIENCSQLTSAPSRFPSIEVLKISNNCHFSLLKNMVSTTTTLSSLILHGDMLANIHSDEHIKSMYLVECNMSLYSCGSLPGKMLEHLRHLPSLRDLKLMDFSNLTRLIGQESFVSTFLERLKITHCSGLTSLPSRMLELSACLQRLRISKCHELTSLPGEMLKSCASLQDLKISYCNGLCSIPGEMLESCASLRILKVFNCPNLVSFPLNLQHIPSLEILELINCPKLMIADMPKGFAFLIGLRKLRIRPFSINETTEFDWSGLVSSSSSTLTILWVYGLPHVKSLPEQIQYFTSLTDLRLCDFEIEALPDWIGNFTSLEVLWLWGCEKLLYLPSVAAMGCLAKLTYLRVMRCTLLEKRCDPQSGLEWPKISHIPYIDI